MSVNGIENEQDEKEVLNTVKTMQEEGRVTRISVDWCAEDVLSLDTTLTPQQVEDVLTSIKNALDATIGINWDVIQFHIDQVKEG